MKCNPLRDYAVQKHNYQKNLVSEVIQITESHPLFEHDFFLNFASGHLDKAVVLKWLKQRHFLSKIFPNLYGNVIGAIPEIDLQIPFVNQLWEEMGSGQTSLIHYHQLCQAIYSAGVAKKELESETAMASTSKLIDLYHKITKDKDYVVSGSIFGLGIEPIIAMDMELSLRGLTKTNLVPRSQLGYFTDHAKHDFYHSWEILDVMLPQIQTDSQHKQIKEGIITILNARQDFYDEVLIKSATYE